MVGPGKTGIYKDKRGHTEAGEGNTAFSFIKTIVGPKEFYFYFYLCLYMLILLHLVALMNHFSPLESDGISSKRSLT